MTSLNINWDNIEIPVCPDLEPKHFPQLMTDLRAGRKVHVERKENGHRRILYKDEAGKMHAYGKRFSSVTFSREDVWASISRSKHIAYLERNLRPGDAVDGEVFVPGCTATDVPSYLKRAPDMVIFHAFGLLFRDHGVCKWNANDCAAELLGMGFTMPKAYAQEGAWLWLDRMQKSLAEGNRDFAKWCDEVGHEGLVLKYSSWGPMFKMKARRTYDCVVMGATDANEGVTGKFLGQIGALICGQYKDGKLVEVARASGMNDEARLEFTKLRAEGRLNGIVVELEAQERTKYGKLQHPQFVRVRDDKNAEDCKA